MSGELSGKTAIVTGGGRGLGRSMALALARAGANVVITAARNKLEIDAVVEQAGKIDGAGPVRPMLADAASDANCQRVVNEAFREFGGVHILVNNAGRGMRFVSEKFFETPTKFWETDTAVWQLIVATNVNGPFFMARAAAPHMMRQRWGRIINISINHETMRRLGFSPYGPSKAALESETIIWAQDLAGTGVTVNALLPGGATDTGMVPPDVALHLRQNLLHPDIMIPPLLWLASDAANEVSGSRFVANLWDSALPPAEAAQKSHVSAGWAAQTP
ncbi:MAG TPA: SDR family oxidoreductase [Verrucomicrobiae bacterium]|jgi:NAD(P)-dependent dehydrogenase (short-subunit alcohol dehydrogenase family)|nr:SDR family oxidoreductase [Verrucomicrobiae bacterium]